MKYNCPNINWYKVDLLLQLSTFKATSIHIKLCFSFCFHRANGPMEFESLRNNVILECERNEEKLSSSWLPSIINIYADKNNFASVRADKADKFFNCVSTLISNQVRFFLLFLPWVRGSLCRQLCGRYRNNFPLKINYSCSGIN